jgi:hypothetical protein
MAQRWMVCSACRTEIPYSTRYYACSVSTCNRSATRLVFCSIACWDSHVAVLRHRDAWAVEERSPPAPGSAPSPTATAPQRTIVTAPLAKPAEKPAEKNSATVDADDSDVLIVVSKMKKYIRDRSGMNASDAIAERLSDHVRAVCEQAIRNAALEDRKTVLDRDVPNPRR